MEVIYKNTHQELIEQCREGDQRAQLELYKMYYKTMYNTSLRILGRPQDAEDIMQDSFLDAFRNLHEFRGTSTFGAWFRRIVINNSLDALKKNAGLTFIEEYDHQIPHEEQDDEDISLKVEEIRQAVGELPADYRIVLSLHLFEGYDHDEISTILNISNNTSRIRYFRAKQKLLEIIKESRIRKFII
ncbi:MAG: RNA polymerase sigma factor [Bacteroidales bacterium]|nr:RNA polymerase sigma factor [Lentimicrobiaceae bacterium]MDD5694365.1 RNA polymerase sigma factor [Bacteroidales bacterium]